MKVGGLTIAPIDVAYLFEEVGRRSALLLSSWAESVDELALLLSDDSEEAATRYPAAGTTKSFSEAEASLGIYVRPGVTFDIVLESPSQSDMVWHYPEIVFLEGRDLNDPSVELVSGEVLRPISRDHSHVTLAATRTGRCELRFFCHARQTPRPSSPVLTVPIVVLTTSLSPSLLAILRCCRGPSVEAAVSPLTPAALSTHRYFSRDTDINEVMSGYTFVGLG